MKKIFFCFIIFVFLMGLSGCQSQDLTKLETWDVVVITASNGWGLADQLQPLIEEELGVTVNMHDLAIGSLDALSVLEGFEGNSLNLNLDSLNELIPETEMIVIFVDPDDIKNFDGRVWGKCFAGAETEKTDTCGPETLGDYGKILAQIYDHIFALKGDSPVIIRALGFYNPIISEWEKADSTDVCNQCWMSFNEEIRRVSAEYNIPFADVWTAYNGEDHLQDPRLKGYILDDGEHPSALGSRVQAETILALGYDPVKR